VAGVRACLIHENFSAHQGVEDDDLNLICFGGLVVGHALAWELVQNISRRALQWRGAFSSPPGESGGFGKQAVNTENIMATNKQAPAKKPEL